MRTLAFLAVAASLTAAAPVFAADAPPGPVLNDTPQAKVGVLPPGLGLRVGDKAPDAEVLDLQGQPVKLAGLYAQGPVFLVFYRGGWCPFCNRQLHNLAAAKEQFDAKGLKLAAISVDRPSEEAKTQAKQGVPFPMLSDSKLAAHQAFKVVHQPGEQERAAFKQYGLDLAAYSGEAHGAFAVASMFLIDKGGTIRFAHADDDYKTRPSVKQMLAAAEAAGLAKK